MKNKLIKVLSLSLIINRELSYLKSRFRYQPNTQMLPAVQPVTAQITQISESTLNHCRKNYTPEGGGQLSLSFNQLLINLLISQDKPEMEISM